MIVLKPDMGIYHDMFNAIVLTRPSLSFLARTWPNIETWRATARAKVFELLAFNPTAIPLNPMVNSRAEEDELIVEEISYDMPFGPRARGFFLYPKERKGRLPAVVALHDHGGFFYYGKEKISSVRNEPRILQEYKKKYYGERSWATMLAKRGFAVLTTDAWLWGSRRIPIESVNETFQEPFGNLKLTSEEECIRKYNTFWENNECSLIVATLLNAGTSWPGIFSYDDRRSVDYLLSRPEIDPDRIGCGGLSMGGLRAAFLAGLDPRIRCGLCVGFMSTIGGLLRNHIKCPPNHGLLMYVPHLAEFLDLPDVITLRAPAPLMVQYNKDDELFTYEGQSAADQRIAETYSKMGYPDNYMGKFYPGAHKFDFAMQEEAFGWLEKWLLKSAL